MSENVQELIARARVAAEVFNHDHAPSAAIASTLNLLADALEAADLTSDEDQMYIRRMEAERDEAYVTIRALTQASK